MRIFILFIFITLTQIAWSDTTPLTVVNERMKAYNAHDIDSFLKLYSEEIRVYTYPNILLGEGGKSQLRNIFEPMFKEAKVSVVVSEQISQGSYVINNEIVTYADSTQKYVSIYEVVNGLIKSVQFIRE